MFSALQFNILTLKIFLGYLSLASARQCKAVPGSPGWPTVDSWNALNETLGGQLIKPIPPGALCHPDQPTYDAAICPSVQASWNTFPFSLEDPVSIAWNNFNNDTCLPNSQFPCSGSGYAQYVVNATSKEHVKAGVDFARENDIRLIVKGTGHDYMGRSSAPNSLSIWTHHMQGLTFSDSFEPKNCEMATNISAVTISAGMILDDIYTAADAKGLVVVGGQALDVGIGGYITGGGHSHLSVLYGMAADQVLQATIVTPSGEILTLNACQNPEYFWAFRGGGGGTFGVLVDVTVKTHPTPPITMLTLKITSPAADDTFFEQMAYIMSQYPYLSNYSISAYPAILPAYPTSATSSVAAYVGEFLLHDGTSEADMTAIFDPIITHIHAKWSGTSLVNSTQAFPSFYAHFQANHDRSVAGTDQVLGSRLLDVEALTRNLTALTEAVKGFTGNLGTSGSAPFLLGGKGVADAVPEGGDDAVLPAWRNSLVHFVSTLTFSPLNGTAKAEAEKLMDGKVQYLRDLIPDSGAYVNEAYIKEAHWQETFWGANYLKLLAIKKEVDPTDVFWCHPCVGSEEWEEVGDSLCRIGPEVKRYKI